MHNRNQQQEQRQKPASPLAKQVEEQGRYLTPTGKAGVEIRCSPSGRYWDIGELAQGRGMTWITCARFWLPCWNVGAVSRGCAIRHGNAPLF